MRFCHCLTLISGLLMGTQAAFCAQVNDPFQPFVATEVSPIADSHIPNLGGGLPVDFTARDILLKGFYEVVIPLLISWDLAHDYQLKMDLIDEDDVVEDFEFIKLFRAATPENPYRQPSPDKVEFLPTSASTWTYSLEGWREELIYWKLFLTLADSILAEESKNNSVQLKGLPSVLLKGLFKRPTTYSYDEFHEFYTAQVEALDALFTPHALTIETRPLSGQEKELLGTFVSYSKQQLNIIQTFLDTYGNRSFESVINDPALKSYYLYSQSRQTPSKLINVDAFQSKNYRNSEVIVLDLGQSPHSSYLNYAKGVIPPTEQEKTTDVPISHGQQVSGVIAGKEELEQLKGVAPGARVLEISDLTVEALDQMRQSSARVINISRALNFSPACAQRFKEWRATPPTLKKNFEDDPFSCQLLWDFVEIVKNKDMLIVKSAGNEGLQIERVDWGTGSTQENLTASLMGAQYYTIITSGYDENALDLTHMWDQIPQLEGRFILAGNLWKDGVTVAPDSSLPGAFPNDFIYAPSEGISTLGQTYLGSRLKAQRDPQDLAKKLRDEKGNIIPEQGTQGNSLSEPVYSEIGAFGGTSGAAPRIAGVFVILGSLLPDLSMPEIRQCVLSTGDPFWAESNNRFWDLADLAKTAGYDLTSPRPQEPGQAKNWDYLARIYGKGRINALKAYQACYPLQESRRQRKSTRSALDLHTEIPVRK